MTSLPLLTAYDSARAEFISDAEDRWQGGKGSAVRDCERLEELARLTVRFQSEAFRIIDPLEVSKSATYWPAFSLAQFVAESVGEYLSPEAARVYSAALACDLEPKEAVREMLAKSVEEGK